jgi:hypothetical protein
MALVANLAFYASASTLAGIACLTAVRRQVSLRAALTSTVLIAVTLGVFRWSRQNLLTSEMDFPVVIHDEAYLSAVANAPELSKLSPHLREALRERLSRAHLPCLPQKMAPAP